MLETCIFSFTHYVFKSFISQGNENTGLSGKD